MKQDREQLLKSRLSVVNKLTLGEAMELLESSESTVRRMFSRLEKEGFATKTYDDIPQSPVVQVQNAPPGYFL